MSELNLGVVSGFFMAFAVADFQGGHTLLAVIEWAISLGFFMYANREKRVA